MLDSFKVGDFGEAAETGISLKVLSIITNLYHYSMLLMVVMWIYAVVVRFLPSGNACCGMINDDFDEVAELK